MNVYIFLRKTLQKLRKAALRVGRLSRCQGVFTKRCHYNYSVTTVIFITITIWVFELSQFFFLVLHDLSFWVWLQLDLSSFVTICFLSFVTVWVLEFCHNLVFCFSFVTVWFFFSFVNIRFFYFSQFRFFSFVTNIQWAKILLLIWGFSVVHCAVRIVCGVLYV